jgi:cytochrome P450
MFPPSTGHNYKEVPKGGVHLLGYYLPEGTQVGVNIMRMLRDKQLFGEDAEVFSPERWLSSETSTDQLKEMASTVELAFGHGKFQCLGKTIAAMELNKVIVEVRPVLFGMLCHTPISVVSEEFAHVLTEIRV